MKTSYFGERFNNVRFFYSYLGKRIFFLLFLSLFVGVLDGFGLTMFIPLLEMVNGGDIQNQEKLGVLSMLFNGVTKMGIPISLVTVLIIMLIFFLLKGLFKFIEGYFRVVYQQYFMRTIRLNLSDALSDYRFDKFTKIDSGRIQNTFSSEIGRVNLAFYSYFFLSQSFILVSVYMGLALFTDPQFAILVGAGGFLTSLLFSSWYKKTKSASAHYTQEAHKFEGLLIQKVTNFKYLKATGLIKNYTEKVKERIVLLEKVQRKLGLLDTSMQALREPLIMLVVVTVIIVQVRLFNQPLATIILSLLFFYRALSYIMVLQKQWNTFLSMSGSLGNMTDFINELNSGSERQGQVSIQNFSTDIVLRNVNFDYDKYKVLDEINLTLSKNKTIAFVGESGSGKTTLINLICGLLEASNGEILVDGIPYSELNLSSLRRRIGYITQDPVIFNDTIFNNVTFWDLPTEKNIQKFNQVLKQSAAHYFVDHLPEKGETLLGNNGVNLSGGQKQRLSIARELYKEIDILIMDEATSSLDSETELSIKNNIDNLKGSYTILIIAHRLSTIRSADQIVLLKKGKIDIIGDFNYLNRHSRLFQKMISLQELKNV